MTGRGCGKGRLRMSRRYESGDDEERYWEPSEEEDWYPEYPDEEDRRIRAQRRRERKARREAQLRRQRARMMAAIAAGVGIVIVVLVLVFGLRGCAAREDGADAGTSFDESAETGSSLAEDTGDTSEDVSEEDQGDGADDAGGEDSSVSDSADAGEESGTDAAALTLPYYYYETADTIDLGESATDISIYDSQRHITSTADSSDSTEGEDASDQSAADSSGEADGSGSEEESGAGDASGTADGDSESGAETVYGDSSDESAEDSESSDETSATDDDYIDSQYVIVVNADTGEIIAERNAYERIIPASMTKVMTLLVAIEAMEDYESAITDTVTITQAITDESYLSGSSFVGYGVDDVATVEDLLYGTILPSGADAALALAEYTAGSKEAFVELMNEKCEELGISETTHFTNVIGLYDDGENYSTPYDMCVIMNAAIDNEYCQAILSQRTWTTQAIMNNPEGTTISNWFLRRAEDHIDNWEILCGKTGFVNESGNCAVSYMKSSVTGTNYIACTALTYSSWRCIYDHAAIYNYYTE